MIVTPAILTGRCKRCEFVTPCDCPCHQKCETCDGRGYEMVDGMYPHGTVERQECGACNGTGVKS